MIIGRVFNEVDEMMSEEGRLAIEEGPSRNPFLKRGAQQIQNQADAGPLAGYVILQIGEEFLILPIQLGRQTNNQALLFQRCKLKRIRQERKGENNTLPEAGAAARLDGFIELGIF